MRGVWSTGTTGRGAVLGLFAVVSGLACGTSHVAGPAIARTGEPDPAGAAARAWLEVFATRDAEKLLQITQLPFTFATRDFPKRCNAMIGDTTRMERLIGCVEARYPELVAELGHAGELKLEPTDRTQLRTSFIQMLGPARPGEHLVHAAIGDRASSFEWCCCSSRRRADRGFLVSALALREDGTIE